MKGWLRAIGYKLKSPAKRFAAFLAPGLFYRLRVWRIARICKPQVSKAICDKLLEMGADVKSGDQVVDLGANIGLVSEFFLNRGAIVHAYEPNPYCAVFLRRLCRFNNFRLYCEAVASTSGKASLYVSKDYNRDCLLWSQGVTLRSEKEDYQVTNTTVDCVTMDTVLERAPYVKLLKVDIEGSEYDIYADIISNMDRIAFVIMETHQQNPSNALHHKQLLDAIAESGLQRRCNTDWQ